MKGDKIINPLISLILAGMAVAVIVGVAMLFAGCSSLYIRKDAASITIVRNDFLVVKDTEITGHYVNGPETLELTAKSTTDPSPGAMVANSLISAFFGYASGKVLP